MKNVYYIAAIIFIFFGCDSEKAPDCLKSAGSIKEIPLDVPPFTAIEINTEFNVILIDGPEQLVTLTTGTNLVNEITYEVIDGKFIIRNSNSCQWVRSYDFPTLKITHPNIARIRQGGSGLIKSEGTLYYPNLSLISEDQSGDFQLELNCEQLSITTSELSNFYLKGQASHLKVLFSSGDSRLEGAELAVETADVHHRGSNDITIQVTDALSGRIASTGDVIYVKTKPAIIDVAIENRGNLIYRPE